MSNNLIAGYTHQDESRESRGHVLPVRRHPRGRLGLHVVRLRAVHAEQRAALQHVPAAEQLHDVTAPKHSLTFGGSGERYESENVFFPGSQSVYVYNSLADFYTDANGYLANPNRTTSPVTLRRFQVRWNNIPGQDEPIQPLEVFYTGVYAQDDWRVRNNLKFNLGLRFDMPFFGDTGFANAVADALTFRDENGSRRAVRHRGKLPDANILWSPRFGFNWDVSGNLTHADPRRHGRLHRPPGVRLDLEPDRQHGRADRLRSSSTTRPTGRSTRTRITTSRPT